MFKSAKGDSAYMSPHGNKSPTISSRLRQEENKDKLANPAAFIGTTPSMKQGDDNSKKLLSSGARKNSTHIFKKKRGASSVASRNRSQASTGPNGEKITTGAG